MAQAEEIRTETGPLDYDYTEKEVELCQENLQNHKACSPDKIKNEMQDVAFSNLPIHIREALPPRSDFRTDNAQSLGEVLFAFLKLFAELCMSEYVMTLYAGQSLGELLFAFFKLLAELCLINLGELLFAFFKLFAELNAEKNCISVLCAMRRAEAQHQVQTDGQTTTVVYRDYVPSFSIEDPFDPTENDPFDPTDNVARAVADTMAPIISSKFKRAVHLLKAGTPWQEVAEAPAKAPRRKGGGGGQSGKNAVDYENPALIPEAKQGISRGDRPLYCAGARCGHSD
eukprot:g73002.t1